ncbi:hypothetical protein EWM62_15010 [Mucilaginibacter terrigena]|uniref:Uncharacterized protein n=1 Tax=Mucilaginibacter terrigena TaxID=2492395 RepID=A0A4Q5LLA3_9SPHI|nr:hypothetical protein [Mucilaginibacter terrigena]RYU89620.1 hypothetical protein EWM62_15010 [Mucilaginibacter terrigena]
MMIYKYAAHRVLLIAALLGFIFPQVAFSQTVFEKSILDQINGIIKSPEKGGVSELSPNDAPQGVMIPSGWGGSGASLFGGIGGSYPQVYTHSPDLSGSVGACIGNPVTAVNFAASLNIANLSSLNNYSANFVLSKKVFAGSSISAGGLQLFASPIHSDAAGSTYFVAFSHAIQSVPSKTPGTSKLSYTIGVGNGRFLHKSPTDIAKGKGKYGTAIFGSLSYEVIQHINLNAEWSGVNLGFSLGVKPFKTPLSVGLGVTNLTSYSSDKPNMVFSIGYPLSLVR